MIPTYAELMDGYMAIALDLEACEAEGIGCCINASHCMSLLSVETSYTNNCSLHLAIGVGNFL